MSTGTASASAFSEQERSIKNDFTVVMLPYYAEVLAADIPERVRGLRLQALKRVQQYLWSYQELGYIPKLLNTIAEKKCERILTITSKTDMEQLIKPRCPHYDGNQFCPDVHIIPEEEMICWSEASLRAPLNKAGFNRYMELFRQVFPEESKRLSI